jgi:hypothetical protein
MFFWAGAILLLGFGLVAPLVRWATAGTVPAWDHLLTGAFVGAMLLWFWWGITQEVAKAHKLAVLVDKLAAALPDEPVAQARAGQDATADRRP